MTSPVPRVVLFLCVATLAAWVCFGASRGFFSGDSGVKMAQAHALWQSSFSARSLPHDYDLDPDGRYHPYDRFARKVGAARQGIYSTWFAGAAAPLFGLLGIWGAPILPFVGAVLVACGLYCIFARLRVRPLASAGGIAATVLATPLILHASQFTEHSLAAGLVTWALALVVVGAKRPRQGQTEPEAQVRPFHAGALVALAATLRPEGYCAVLSLGLAVAFMPSEGASALASVRMRSARSAKYLLGATLVLGAYWATNLLSSGTWDPLVTANHGRSATMRYSIVMLVGELGRPRVLTWLLPLLVPVVVSLFPPAWRRGRTFVAVHAMLAVGLAFLAWRAQSLSTARVLTGMFSVTPLAAYGLLGGPWRPGLRSLWLFSVSFLAQVLILDNGGDGGGLQLGARLLFLALPPLVALATAVLDDDLTTARRAGPLTILAVVLLVGIGARGTWIGVRQAEVIADGGRAASEKVLSLDAGVVMTVRWWESQVLAPVLLGGKQLYSVYGDPRPFLERLAARGVRSLVVIGHRPLSVELSGGKIAQTESVSPGWLGVQLVRIGDVVP
ncbi:MAG: hypothetical protein HY698_05780 [Deltaproteobacteria bacterium]|nr:hypothetical protein [Deltaproteobacteria bacterium]